MLVGVVTKRKQWRLSTKVLLSQLTILLLVPDIRRRRRECRAAVRAACTRASMNWIAPVGPGVNSADRSAGFNRLRRPPRGASLVAPVAGLCWLQRPLFRLAGSEVGRFPCSC